MFTQVHVFNVWLQVDFAILGDSGNFKKWDPTRSGSSLRVCLIKFCMCICAPDGWDSQCVFLSVRSSSLNWSCFWFPWRWTFLANFWHHFTCLSGTSRTTHRGRIWDLGRFGRWGAVKGPDGHRARYENHSAPSLPLSTQEEHMTGVSGSHTPSRELGI